MKRKTNKLASEHIALLIRHALEEKSFFILGYAQALRKSMIRDGTFSLTGYLSGWRFFTTSNPPPAMNDQPIIDTHNL